MKYYRLILLSVIVLYSCNEPKKISEQDQENLYDRIDNSDFLSPLEKAETIIGPTVKVKGNFHGQGNIIIEGIVEGSVKTTNHLFIAEKAKILAMRR